MKSFNDYVKSLRKPLSENDRAILRSLILKYEHVIENKKFDSIVSAQKNAAWIDIAKEFNARSHCADLSVKQVRKCWENMKFKMKRAKKLANNGDSILPTASDDDTATSYSQNIDFVESNQEDPLELPNSNPTTGKPIPKEDSKNSITNPPIARKRISKEDTKEVATSLIECAIEAKLQRLCELIQQEKEFHDLRMMTENEVHKLNMMKLKLEIDLLRDGE